MRRWRSVLLGGALAALVGCGNDGEPASTPAAARPLGIHEVGPWNTGVALPAEPQTTGDAQRGRDTLLSGDFMTCGLPAKLWDTAALRAFISEGLGGAKNPPR